VAVADGFGSPLTAAHRRCWAARMRRRVAALSFPRLGVRTFGFWTAPKATSVEHLVLFHNPVVDLFLLRFKAFDGSKDYSVILSILA